MFGFKSASKSKRKAAVNIPLSTVNASNEPKVLYNVPSVSQIAPLPQNKSHGTLPVLSLDGRDAPLAMESETSENDLASSNGSKTNPESDHQPVGEICQMFFSSIG